MSHNFQTIDFTVIFTTNISVPAISDNNFVSAIIHNTFATIPLSTIPYTGVPRICWLWDCWLACRNLSGFPSNHTFERFFQEHTEPAVLTVSEEIRLREVVRQVAEIARAHGHRVELGWFEDLLTYHNVMWVDSWVRSSTLGTIPVLLTQVEQLVAITIARRQANFGEMPIITGVNDDRPTLAHTIAHLRCFQTMLKRVGGMCGFVNACGITTAAQETEYGSCDDVYGKCVVELKKLLVFKMCNGVLVASIELYDKLGDKMQPLPEGLMYALVLESCGVPMRTPDWIIRSLMNKPAITLNLGTDGCGNRRVSLRMNQASAIPVSDKHIPQTVDQQATHNALCWTAMQWVTTGEQGQEYPDMPVS